MKNKTDIRFGTDGWRGVIADDFTLENVQRVARAIALHVREEAKDNALVTVGYDTRFHSRYFAETVAGVLAAGGCDVILSDTFLSTPALSSSVVTNKAFGGVMISASHNPAEFNGIKFKTSCGCSSPEQVTRRFEALLDAPVPPARAGKQEQKKLV
ncbi:MAG: phosphoglucomutase/phosphomannomutase family protein, partial [Endomicrobiales bacterium]